MLIFPKGEENYLCGTINISQTPSSALKIEGGNLQLFKWLADNTNVEWTGYYNGGKKASDCADCTMYTSHENDSCASIPSSNCDTMIHSHPNWAGFTPSSDDYQALDEVREQGVTTGLIYNRGKIREL